MRPKIIKVRQQLYEYIKKTGEYHFGKNKSMPYYLYLIAKKLNKRGK